MLDPVVHAALVTLALVLVKYLFGLIGVPLGDDISTKLAEIIVAYILSLFGYALWVRATAKAAALSANRWYNPPFTN